ncbi:flippase [Candidatus Woesearchaeota archaeon]|nr:flippase [Candidatus Woesearchaeota archaeon]
MATARRISSNMAALSFAELVSKLLQFAIMVYAARQLDKESFGVFSFALAFSFIAVIFADLGINTYLIREIARDKKRAAKYYGSAFLVKTGLAIATFFLIFAVLWLLGYPQQSRIVAYLVWLFAILSSFTDLSYSVFRSFERMGYDSFIKILRMVILTALTFYVLSNGYGVVAFSLSFVVTEIAIFLVSLSLVFSRFIKPVFGFSFSSAKSLLKSSIPFGLAIVFGSVYFYISSVMLSKIKGNVEVASFGAAYNLVLALLFVPAIYTTAVYPVMSRYFGKDDVSLKFIFIKSWKYLYMIGLPISFGIFLLADSIISILYGTKYASSALALKIVAWFVFIKFVNYLLGITLYSINAQNGRMSAQGVTAVFNVILNFALIPYYGFVGAAIATLATEIFLFVVYYYYTSKYFFRHNFLADIPKPLIASLIMSLIIIYSNLNIFFIVPLSMLVYFTALLLLKAFDKEDIGLLRRVIGNEAA